MSLSSSSASSTVADRYRHSFQTSSWAYGWRAVGDLAVRSRFSVLLYDHLVSLPAPLFFCTRTENAVACHLSRIGEWNLEQVRQKTLIPHPGRRILFIDTLHHDPSVTESVEQLGLEITVVANMEEACLLDQAQSGYFDTVLVDQISVVERLRDVEHLRYIPLVLITPQIPQLNLKVRFFSFHSQS